MVEFSKLMSLSLRSSFVTNCLYLLSRNISSAFCILNEQHMPRSVGNMVNMLEQLTRTPFHAHHFITPEHAFEPTNHSPQITLTLTMFIILSACDLFYIKARHLRVPQHFKDTLIPSLKVHIFIHVFRLLPLCLHILQVLSLPSRIESLIQLFNVDYINWLNISFPPFRLWKLLVNLLVIFTIITKPQNLN